MKLNLTKLALSTGLSLGMLSIASVAEAGIRLKGTSLTGYLPQPTTKRQPQQFKALSSNDSSLTGQTTEKQLPQELWGLPANGSSLTGQVSQKQQKR